MVPETELKDNPQPPVETAPAPTAQHHLNLSMLLQVILHLTPAIVAPFVKSKQAVTIFQTETPIVEALADAIAGNGSTSAR